MSKVEALKEKIKKKKDVEKSGKKKKSLVEDLVSKIPKKKKVVEEEQTKKSKEVVAEPVVKKKSKKESKEEAKSILSSIVDYDSEMDSIEKKYDTNSSQLATDPRAKLSTGLLVQDLVLSGGLLGGGWYTYFGQEQSAKSTLAMQSIIAAMGSETSLIGYYDYEGCVTTDTLFSVGGKQVSLRDLIPLELQENLPEKEGPIIFCCLPNIDTLGGSVDAQLYYGGIKECLRVTTETGNTLEGSGHPFMVQLPDGNLAWKMIEELSIGDIVLQQG